MNKNIELFRSLKTEAERLGVTFRIDSEIPGQARYRIKEKEIVLSGKHDLPAITHELVHFLQMEYGYFLWGPEEKEALASATGDFCSLWGTKISQNNLMGWALEVMENYPKEVQRLEVPAYALQDQPVLILRVMKEL